MRGLREFGTLFGCGCGQMQPASGAEQVSDPTDVISLTDLPKAVRTRVLRRAAIAAGVPAGALTAAHVDAIDALVIDWHGQGAVSLPGGLVASRACDRLSFR